MTRSERVVKTVARCREALAAGQTSQYSDLKKKLPAFTFMATFENSRGKTGKRPLAPYRLQQHARLTGLVMHDFDHLSAKGTTPRELFSRVPQWMMDDKEALCLLYAGQTVSGDGLRLVTTADVRRGNIAAQQAHVASILGMEADESVKNADRTSFAVTEKDIFYINDIIFDYQDDEFDKTYGDQYRACSSAEDSRQATPSPAPQAAEPWEDGGAAAASEAGADELTFNGVDAQKIIDRWLEVKITPKRGQRHMALLRLVSDLRYVCDNNPQTIARWARLAPFVQEMEREGDKQEVERCVSDVCQNKMLMYTPRKLQEILVEVGAAVKDDKVQKDAMWDTSANLQFEARLKPLLTPPYDLACSMAGEGNGIGAVFASGAMFCSLMTRCWYEHFTGTKQRMNPQVYVIGMPADGKSFVGDLNKMIMGVMKAADAVGRKAEEDYQRKLKERQNSSKAAKGEPLKLPEIMVRYCTGKMSNSVFFTRLRNAHEEVDGEDMPLHLYMFDSELDAVTSAQKGGTWIDKHDIELKAFHNEETGVDYKNLDSANGIYNVYYNSVCTGTPLSLSRKINLRNVNDGLCSRVAFFRMMPNNYKMIAKGSLARNFEKECQLKQWGFRFDTMHGELKIKALVDHVYKLCEDMTWVAEASSDKVLDFLRKRAVFYATWFTIPRIYGRQWEQYQKTGEVTIDDSDLQFASLMYDAVIYWQDLFFGRMLQESFDNAAEQIKPRARNSANNELFGRLPETFTTKDAAKLMGISNGGVGAQLSRWIGMGVLERVSQGKYKKKVTIIDK